jgi:hypothetical protein
MLGAPSGPARAGPPARPRRRPTRRRTIRAARPAGHEVLPLPPQPRRLVDGTVAATTIAGAVELPVLEGARRRELSELGCRPDPCREGGLPLRPAPRSNAKDRPLDARQARRPALPRGRPKSTPTSRCSPPLSPSRVSPAWTRGPGRRLGGKHRLNTPGRYAYATPGPLSAQRSTHRRHQPALGAPTSQPVRPAGQRRLHVRGVSRPPNARFR